MITSVSIKMWALQILQIGGRDVVFQVVPGQVGVDLRVETGGDGPLVKDLHFRPGGPGDDGFCLGFSMLGFPLNLRDRWGAVVWLCVGPLRAASTLFLFAEFLVDFFVDPLCFCFSSFPKFFCEFI